LRGGGYRIEQRGLVQIVPRYGQKFALIQKYREKNYEINYGYH
jgi:hypothetical protein